MKFPNSSNQLSDSGNGAVISSIDKYNDEVELTGLEKKAIEIIKNAFEEQSIPFNVSFRRRSKDYLTLLIYDSQSDYYNDFCRIKAGIQSTWLSLDIGRASKLAEDIRFSNVAHKERRHWKVNLNCVEDFEEVADLIIADYQFIIGASNYVFVPKAESTEQVTPKQKINNHSANNTESEYTTHYIHKKGNNLCCFVDDYVLFDLETTDRNIYRAKIIEIAAVKVRNNEIIEKFDRLVDPKTEIPTEITELTGITNEMVSGVPTINEVLPEFLNFIGNDVLVGHNINTYDLNIINIFTNKISGFSILNDFVDTLDLARHLIGINVPNYKLKTLCEFWNIKNDNAHRAYSDVIANNECYQKMRNYITESYKSPYANNEGEEIFTHKNLTNTYIKCDFTTKIDIKDKTICLTGDFAVGSRKDIVDRISEFGGIVKKNVIKSLDYLVIGSMGSVDYKEGTLGGKYESAVKYNNSGANIAIVNEKDFFDLLEN